MLDKESCAGFTWHFILVLTFKTFPTLQDPSQAMNVYILIIKWH